MDVTVKLKLYNIMSEGLARFRKATAEVVAFYEDKSTTDQWKYEHAALIADRLTSEEQALQGELAETWEKAADALDAVKRENSTSRMGDNEYQRRLMAEVDFIRHLPDSMTRENVQARIDAFFGDELARGVLVAALKETSDSRKQRGVMGFDTAVMLPDVYGLQRAMLDKIAKTIDKKLFDLGADFIARQVDSRAQGNNEKIVMMAEGIFTGLTEYMERLPMSVSRPAASLAMTGVNFHGIPCYAETADDLKLYFSMYRKPKE